MAFVVYVRTPNFIDICTISDFFPMIFFFKFCGSFNFILFKHLLLYIRPLIYLFDLGRDRFFTVCICFKETCFSYNQYFSLPQTLFFNFSFRLFNIFPYLRALANIGCQLLVMLLQVQVKKSKNERK